MDRSPRFSNGPSRGVSRREFVQLGVAGVAAAAVPMAGFAKLRSEVGGLHVGLQTFSLRGLRYTDVIPAMQKMDLGECELYSVQVEPTAAEAPDIVKWRMTVPLDFFKDVRKQFNRAGIDIFTYNPRFGAGGGRGRGPGGPGGAGGPGAPGGPGAGGPAAGGPGGAGPGPGGAPGGPGGGPGGQGAGPGGAGRGPGGGPPAAPVTDEEIERTFEFTKALGAKSLSTQMTLDMAHRLAPFAAKHKIIVAMASQDEDALKQVVTISPYFKMDVDIGNFTRGGLDSLQFVKDNYEHLLDIHLKDCKFRGPSVPFGEGDSHMKETLQFLRDKKSQARANIDCDYPGTGTSVEEVQKCYDFVKAALA